MRLQDCIDFTDLTREQIEAVARHEGLPEVVALEWAETVLDQEGGRFVLERILAEEIEICHAHGDCDWEARFKDALRRMLEEDRIAAEK